VEDKMNIARLRSLYPFFVIFILLACNVPMQIPDPGTTGTTSAAPQSEDPAATERALTDPTIAVTGPIEVVYDWSTDRCDYNDRPDMPLRPFRDSDGNVQANRSYTSNRRFLGADLDSIRPLCETILQSDHDPDPANYNSEEWLQAYYTEDGRTIHAIVHNEHNTRGSNYWNMTSAFSTDGGRTFQQPEPPNHFVAGSPHEFIPDSGRLYGLLQGSNIIKGPDGAYYMLVENRTYDIQTYTCLFRTEDLSDPGSWRAWNGRAFDWKPINPYLEAVGNPSARECPAIDLDVAHGIGFAESLIYNTYLDRYISVSLGPYGGGSLRWGVVYSTSVDLIHWENKKFLQEMTLGSHTGSGGANGTGYVVLLDPDSGTRNFETADKTGYVYYVRFNHSSAMVWPDTDLVRFPVEFFPNEDEAFKADVRTELTLKRMTGSDVVGFTGSLTGLDGSPRPGSPVQIVAVPDDEVGLPYEYTFQGTVPQDVSRATAGLRVNTECNCSAASELYIYEISYVEEGGANRIQGNRFQSGMQNFIKWGLGRVSIASSDLGDGRMMHVRAGQGEEIGLNSWEFTVTPGASFTFTVKARVVPGSFGTGFFGLFMIPGPGAESLRVAIPFSNPETLIGEVITDANGNYEFIWQNAPSGRYEIKAFFPGDGQAWESSAQIKSIVR
jgi:hypothetical protein